MKKQNDTPNPGEPSASDRTEAFEEPLGEDYAKAAANIMSFRRKLFAINGTPSYSLSDILPRVNAGKLREIYREHSLAPGPSKLRKQQLVDALLTQLPNEDDLRAFILMQPDMQWELFNDALKAKALKDEPYTLDRAMLAFMQGYVYMFYHQGAFTWVMPDEIKAAFGRIDDEELRQEMAVRSWLNNYACAAANLYGVLELADLADIINSYVRISRKDRLDANDLSYFLQGYAHFDIDYRMWNGCLVSGEMTEEDDDDDQVNIKAVRGLLKMREGKPRFTPDEKTFLRYADPDYYEETPQVKALKKALRFMKLSMDEAEDLTDTLHEKIAAGGSFSEILKSFDECGVTLKESQADRIIQLIIDMVNNTRIWGNFGHTPDEMVKTIGIQSPRTIRFGPGMVNLFKNDEMSAEELQQKIRDMHFSDHKFEASLLSEIARAKGLKDGGEDGDASAPGNVIPLRKVGRNEPCPCGSGLKYKKCCGKNE